MKPRQARRTWGRWLTQGRLAANPEKAHTRDDSRTSTASGMPNAMLAHTPSVAQGFGVLSNRLISAGSVTRLDFGVMRNSAQGSTLSRTNRQPNEDAVHRSHPSCEQTSSLAADESAFVSAACYALTTTRRPKRFLSRIFTSIREI